MHRVLAVALLLAAGGTYWAAKARAPRPNVLLVTIDTLRPDAVGAEQGTPAMAAFLGEATRFARTRTVAPMTLPAHASLFTGLFPAAHGLHDNVTEPLPARERRPFPLLAEQFRDAGYSTAAFVACGVLRKETGLASGFETFECPEGYDQRDGNAMPGEERVEAAVRWVEGAPGGRPWFLWVHLFDPHAPYLPFSGDAHRPATREGDPPWNLYLGGVRRADAAFEKLLAAAGSAVVVLASDHGESLGEHDETSHGPLCYGTTVDSLLAVRARGFDRGAEDKGLRSIADVAPTLRRLCRLPSVPGDGIDLRDDPHETLVAESLFTWRVHGWGQCFSVTDGVHTLVESGPRLELFDRRRDPGEERPLGFSDPKYEKLDRALERFRAAGGVERDGEVVASLPAYGQMRRRGSHYLRRHENARLLDPRPHLASWLMVDQVPWIVRMALERRDPAPLEHALRMVADFEQATPLSPLVAYYRARVFEAKAELLGERSWLGLAARAQLDAVDKGYTHTPQVRQAIECAVKAHDRAVLHALADLLQRDGQRLDPEIARALDDAAAEIDAARADAVLR